MKKSFKKTISLLLTVMMLFTAMGGCVTASAQEAAFEQTIEWAAEYDVVVIGYGAAGASAAITAADDGVSVLILEKAPKGEEGGNSRICAQGFSGASAEDREAVLTYMHALCGDFSTPSDAILETYVDGMIENERWAREVLGAEVLTITEHKEFPDFPGGGYKRILIGEKSLDGKMYATLQQNVEKRDIDVWYSAPAMHLIQDPATKIIHGVVANVDGVDINIRAKNGVVLAPGGYENNEWMVENYIGRTGLVALGNIKYNTGDGITMAAEVGARLWHMGNNVIADFNFYNEEAGVCTFGTQPTISGLGCIMVGGDGTRFMAESTKPSHGKIYFHGTNISVPYPDDVWVVLDETIRLSGKLDKTFSEQNEEEIASGWLIKADTIEELAGKIGVPAENLAKTITQYNGFVDAGEDIIFGRKPETMVSRLETAPYYAIRLVPAICNTQGGPERNEKAEIIGLDGNPIPHLYGAGECGDIWSYCYNAYSNVGGGMVFGRIAGANAAEAKNDVLAESLMNGKANYVPAAAEAAVETAENQYVGRGQGKSEIAVLVTMEGDKIAAVEVIQHNETPVISDRAIEQIPAAIVAANSAEVDIVVSATMTSKGIMEAVADALSQVK